MSELPVRGRVPKGPTAFRRRLAAAGWTTAVALAASAATGPPAPVSGQGTEGGAGAQEGALFLLLPVGAQGVGLARAMTALSSDEGAFWNPAGLAEQSKPRVMVYRGEHLVGEAIAANGLVPWKGVGTFGLSYLLLEAGEQDLRDGYGNVLGSISVRNHVGIASFATSFRGRVHAGINMKLVQFRVACRGECPDLDTSSSAYAVDVGVQAQPFADVPLRIGGMVAHAGTEFQIVNEEQSDPLPTRIRLAAAYQVFHRRVAEQPMDLWLALEAEDRARKPGSPSLYAGLAFSVAELVSVRAGYVGGELDQADGASAGVGFRFGRFDLNLAKSLARSSVTGETEPVHVTFGVAF